MTKIQFNFQGKRRTHEFFFGVHPGVNGFSLRDDRGVMYVCFFDNGMVHVYGIDLDFFEEKSRAVEI